MRGPSAALRAGAPASDELHDREVLIVGGGIAGVEALMALADLGDHHLRVRLVAAHQSFVLRPQIVGQPWGGAPLHIDLERLCRAFCADFLLGTVTHVDAGARTVVTTGGTTLPYDELLLAPGAHLELPYEATRVLGFGALPEALAAGTGSVAVVVPPTTSWTLPAYELALLTAQVGGRDVRVVTGEATPLEAFGPGTTAAVRELLDRHGVRVETDAAPVPGSDLGGLADTVIALPLLRGPAIGGVQLDHNGFVQVDERMAVIGHDHIHAAGDATEGAIKQGGLAGQQADTAAAEIVRSCGGDPPPTPYEPVLRGKLATVAGDELFLRRTLDGRDEGRSSLDKLWEPPGVVCAWRVARWLTYRRDELDLCTTDHVARPHVTAGV